MTANRAKTGLPMPIDFLVLSAAFLTGISGGLHCSLMCGGIASTLNAKSDGPAWGNALALNVGRIGSYTFAGLLAGTLGTAFVGVVRRPELALTLRSMMGLFLMLIALRLLFPKKLAFALPGNGLIWRFVSRLQGQLPSAYPWRALGSGALWGWLPCGLSTSVLPAAWLEASPLHSSLLILAFGLGTLPLMTAISISGARFSRILGNNGLRVSLALSVFFAGAITATAPWLMQVPELHRWLVLLGCRSLA